MFASPRALTRWLISGREKEIRSLRDLRAAKVFGDFGRDGASAAGNWTEIRNNQPTTRLMRRVQNPVLSGANAKRIRDQFYNPTEIQEGQPLGELTRLKAA